MWLKSFLLLQTVLCGKLLVLYENPQIQLTHSKLFDALKNSGDDLTFKSADDASLEIIRYGVNIYRSVIILAPSIDDFGGKLTAANLIEFMDNGGTVFIATDTTVGDVLRDVAAEVGMEIDEAGTKVIDHSSVSEEFDDGSHTAIEVQPSQLLKAPKIVGSGSGPITFEGVGMKLDETNNLVFPLVVGSPNSYSWFSEEAINDYPLAIGEELVLVAGLEARNNARIVVSGSLSMFSDKFQEGNDAQADFVKSVILWATKNSGVLRYSQMKHHRVGESETPAFYTINEQIRFEMKMEELVEGKWVPFTGKDVQVDYHRLDPFVRRTHGNDNGILSTEFKLPDTYGVFQFRVNYNRIEYTSVELESQLSVRPLRHDQYERFISSAYPYYFSSFSMMIGVSLLSFVVLYHSDAKKKTE